ncbi:MAG: WecB/TagA/CpsF family glycosyltransferase [Fusicatenibacter sp.]|nr:WecB/TagA/CpsF family glycosyltransferase [Lachnospiraceae bacterium]MDY2936700.1 WecB/TagA/CpsF family glycosyltransferase [Fusicatenibacter sp.]
MMNRIKILDTYVDNLTMAETVTVVDQFIKEKKPLHLMGVNADKINMLRKDPQLKDIVNGCDVINADGASVVWASKVLGKPLKERVAGIDLMYHLMELAEKRGYQVYFLGAKQEVVTETVDIVKKMHPALQIVGYRNGYFKKDEWSEIAEMLRESRAQIVFVGITSPLKEYLVEYLQNQDLNCVFMGVGGSFDVVSGNIPRAPKWVQNIGMEWLFRVLQEPGRLWKRYFFGNIEFITSVYREKFRKSK